MVSYIDQKYLIVSQMTINILFIKQITVKIYFNSQNRFWEVLKILFLICISELHIITLSIEVNKINYIVICKFAIALTVLIPSIINEISNQESNNMYSTVQKHEFYQQGHNGFTFTTLRFQLSNSVFIFRCCIRIYSQS